MSSRYEKEKRLRPKNNPYKRDQFNQTEYLRINKNNSTKSTNVITEEEYEEEYDDEYYDDYE